MRTGVTHASVPSKILSHSFLVFFLNSSVNSSNIYGHDFRSSLGPDKSEGVRERPFSSESKNCGSIAPLDELVIFRGARRRNKNQELTQTNIAHREFHRLGSKDTHRPKDLYLEDHPRAKF